MKDWLYIAPQRIRAEPLALPRCNDWDAIENLNKQRLARVFEFQGCIGFVGSGVSADLGYPPWVELLPQPDPNNAPTYPTWEEVLKKAEDVPEWQPTDPLEFLDKLKLLSTRTREGKIDASQALQIAETLLGETGRELICKRYLKSRFFHYSENDAKEKEKAEVEKDKAERAVAKDKPRESPFIELLKMPIRRFITTNYDLELEAQLEEQLGNRVWRSNLSFEQDKRGQMAIFAVALARENRNMVFHCHGTLHGELRRFKEPKDSRKPSRMVLTDADYNHWYLSKEPSSYTFQRSMDVILQSNPLLFVGYSISDIDLLRILRQANLRWDSERIASNLFVLLKMSQEKQEDGCPKEPFDQNASDEWKQAKQIKLGANLIPFNSDDKECGTLSDRLALLSGECSRLRKEWLTQPKLKSELDGLTGMIGPRLSSSRSPSGDPLFNIDKGSAPGILSSSLDGLDELLKHNRVVALIGGAGSGKLMKACQYADWKKGKYDDIFVFHSYNNDDIYAYFKRLNKKLHDLSRNILIVVNNIDLLLGDEPGDHWRARNSESIKFLRTLINIQEEDNPEALVKIIITARSLDYPENRRGNRRAIPEVLLEADDSFTAAELFNFDGNEAAAATRELEVLRWELQQEHAGLLIATRFVAGADPWGADRRQERMGSLLQTLQANSSEMGTRVVRHVIRDLDGNHGRFHETLLWFLSCFNTPFTRDVYQEVYKCCDLYLNPGTTPQDELCEGFAETFLSLGLMQRVGESDVWRYIVPPLVKRYYREIMEKSQPPRKAREFGLHGLLSRGPFNSPGCSQKPKILFDHFVKFSFEHLKAVIDAGGIASDGHKIEQTMFGIRAILDILRSNFACNSVPQWGKFRDYIDMLSMSIDLVRNFALSLDMVWKPSELGMGERDSWISDQYGIASVEEMLYLYNELGLAYYQIGSVQDANRVWGLADDWCKVILSTSCEGSIDREQGEMYSATINSHLGACYMQLGRMQVARECFEKSLKEARKTRDPDLACRMEGMLARLDHFSGSLREARTTYRKVIQDLGRLKNRRGQSYFMRHLAALESRLGNREAATSLADQSAAIAASEEAPDLVAFALECKARITKAAQENIAALREYRMALMQAEKLDIARLSIDNLLGMAQIQLRLGDISAARASALEALKRANEHLLVLRQAKALIVLGQAAGARKDLELARSILGHAKKLAGEAMFTLTEQDAQRCLADLSAQT